MLVNKQKYKSGDIISIKISNGDEVVTKFVEEIESGFMVLKPLTVMPTQNGIALVPSLFTSESELPLLISFRHIMLHGLTIKEMSDHYIKKTSGIQIATAGGVIR
jgi:hypothetical protein